MKYWDVAEDLRSICTALFGVVPWISAFLMKLRVVGVEDMPCDGAVNDMGVLFINVSSWRRASMSEKVFILLHEALHVALKHFARARNILDREGKVNLVLFNVACDLVIDDMLIMDRALTRSLAKVSGKHFYSLLSKVACTDVKYRFGMSCEEIYHLLLRKVKVVPDITIDLCFDTTYGEGDVIQEGSPEIYSKPSWMDVASRIESVLRSIEVCFGGLSGCGGYMVAEELLKPKINWRAELRESIRRGVGRNVVSTWTKRHRKLPGLAPGIVMLRRPDIYCLVDVSGSISQNMVNQFFTEIFTAARLSKVHAVFFDEKVRGVFRVRPGIIPRVEGGGGTVISPALSLVYKKARRGDIVVVLTDGLVSDERKQDKWLRKLASKVGEVIYCSTARFPNVEVKKVKLEV